jgi:hypothetical protein
VKNSVIARQLRVNARPVQRLLSEVEFTELEDELAKGAAGHGRHD